MAFWLYLLLSKVYTTTSIPSTEQKNKHLRRLPAEKTSNEEAVSSILRSDICLPLCYVYWLDFALSSISNPPHRFWQAPRGQESGGGRRKPPETASWRETIPATAIVEEEIKKVLEKVVEEITEKEEKEKEK